MSTQNLSVGKRKSERQVLMLFGGVDSNQLHRTGVRKGEPNAGKNRLSAKGALGGIFAI